MISWMVFPKVNEEFEKDRFRHVEVLYSKHTLKRDGEGKIIAVILESGVECSVDEAVKQLANFGIYD